ncbi:DUF4136 domain-containing protein [Dasania sp. GY-MA-18]|uniref:DUF4136 domain-containing protein n=1 Tax=Dasania phycosphaerae TaxID=2950436 RepID=A0A9J6RKA4_9GAMM|nr:MULTISPECIES: DUF4136 domain-containing protein [Dasania]MCR8922408.1 DUF4136 domain-containing protein [Dasania sp. GY-MA-18]MCZ0864836.1 DUF4136 domain-containing protein [Dasania phycosphaerae]MCZ0868564.1 DUF4136 domain-containing protein [Dasania phycosphaerae]
MIKTISTSLLLCLLAACQSSPVATDYDTSTDFSHYRYYQLTPSKADENALMQKRLQAAIEKHISLTGLQKSQQQQDHTLLVSPLLRSQQRTQEPNSRGGIGLGSGGGGSFFGVSLSVPLSSETLVNDVSISVTLLDAQTSKVVWQGNYAFTVDADDPAAADEMVDKAVTDILASYPPKPSD